MTDQIANEQQEIYGYSSLTRKIGGDRQIWAKLAKSQKYKELFTFLSERMFVVNKPLKEMQKIYKQQAKENKIRAAKTANKARWNNKK